MSVLNLIAGPLIGAVIGYFTNYLAVKMLFKPYYPVKIGSHTLPFTPGIIPKGKGRLARALGKAVGDNLFTNEDMQNLFSSREVKKAVLSGITSCIEPILNSTLEDFMLKAVTEDELLAKKDTVTDLLCDKIKHGISKIDIAGLICEKGAAYVSENLGGFVAMFLSEDKIRAMAEPIGNDLEQYLQENCEELIRPAVYDEVDSAMGTKLSALSEKIGINKDKLYNMLSGTYDSYVAENIPKILQSFDISSVVREKVDAMDVKEVEKLVLSVMEKELKSVVNLGALIGLIIGIVNIFI